MVIEITEQQLREIFNSGSKSLVGKICKRLEILALQDIPSHKKDILIKELIKEHIYENARDELFSILAVAKGIQSFRVELITSKDGQK